MNDNNSYFCIFLIFICLSFQGAVYTQLMVRKAKTEVSKDGSFDISYSFTPFSASVIIDGLKTHFLGANSHLLYWSLQNAVLVK